MSRPTAPGSRTVWILFLALVAAGAGFLAWEFILHEDRHDDGLADFVIERSIDDNWPAESVRRTYEVVDILIARKMKLHPFFRPAVASKEFILALEIKPHERVADIGCGTGALAIGMLEHGVPFGHLYEEDINAPSLEFVSYTLEKTAYPGRERVTVVKGAVTDPRLPARSLDRVFVINVPGLDASMETTGGKPRVPPRVAAFYKVLVKSLRPGGEVQVLYEGEARTAGQTLARKAVAQAGAPAQYIRHAAPLTAAGLTVQAYEERTVRGRVYEVVSARLMKDDDQDDPPAKLRRRD